jgi:predicted nucleic acid-binding protein
VLVVDSSVWIDYFRGAVDARTDELNRLLTTSEVRIVVPDLVFYEVLRGFRLDREHRRARGLLEIFGVEPTGGADLALHAAEHYRALRAMGRTIRNSVDVLIASHCIEHDYILLHNDRDYDAFAAHRGLRLWQH